MEPPYQRSSCEFRHRSLPRADELFGDVLGRNARANLGAALPGFGGIKGQVLSPFLIGRLEGIMVADVRNDEAILVLFEDEADVADIRGQLRRGHRKRTE